MPDACLSRDAKTPRYVGADGNGLGNVWSAELPRPMGRFRRAHQWPLSAMVVSVRDGESGDGRQDSYGTGSGRLSWPG